jgi:glutamine amidotransferase-like uncharacterized protein
MSDPEKADIKMPYSVTQFRERKIPISCKKITVEDVHNGVLKLEDFDLFYMMGGFAPNYYYALGDRGHEMIESFVKKGGGYVGICAGAYYGAGSSNGIRLIDVDIFDERNWNRG